MDLIHSKVTSKGQVTIPQAIRKAWGLSADDTLQWRVDPDGVVSVRKVGKRCLREIVGMLGVPPRSATVEEIREAIRSRFRGHVGS